MDVFNFYSPLTSNPPKVFEFRSSLSSIDIHLNLLLHIHSNPLLSLSFHRPNPLLLFPQHLQMLLQLTPTSNRLTEINERKRDNGNPQTRKCDYTASPINPHSGEHGTCSKR